MHGLSQAMGVMVTDINNLTSNVNLANNVCPRMTKVAVTKPKVWNGKGGSMEARHFLAAFFNYTQNEGDVLNNWDAGISDWQQNDDKWIVAVLNLMEDEARTWVLPYLETIAAGRTPFSGLYRLFTEAFTKRFALLDTTEAVREALKALRQGKHSMAEYISQFDQYTGQTGWSPADHRTRFYDSLQDQLKDNLAITDQPINMYEELCTS